MDKEFLGNGKAYIHCPKCGHELEISVFEGKKDFFPCPHCGFTPPKKGSEVDGRVLERELFR